MQTRFALLALAPALLFADDFPEPYNSEQDKDSQPLAPAAAAASFEGPDELEVTVFAAEPELRNPVAMAWDPRGRLWIAENYTYAEKGVRIAEDLRDRVLILEDRDHDGVADERRVFSDTLSCLTGLETAPDGLWVMACPQLLFIPDRDGDDVPDGPPEVVLDGFEVAEANHHNFANGLRWGPDGWLYGRTGGSCPGHIGPPGTPPDRRIPLQGGLWRFHPELERFEVLCHGTTNPWGHDWDRHGEAFFINTVIGHLWHLIPGAHYQRPFIPSWNQALYHEIDQHADHYHFDTSGSWMESRDGAANSLGGGHAHIGMTIYQADHFPALRDRLITWNMHGRRANTEILERRGSGYVGKHGPDILISGDPWFRGIEIQTGPDGALYAIDWSDTGECHENTGVHRHSGRVFRFSRPGLETPELADLATLDGPALARLLRHDNVWFPRLAAVTLRQRETAAHAETARALLDSDEPTPLRLRALWQLHQLEALERDALVALLDEPDEYLRTWAIRLLTDTWPIDTLLSKRPAADEVDDPQLISRFTAMAAEEPSAHVRLALASTLQRLPHAHRARLATALAGRAEDAGDHNLPALVWYGLIPLREHHAEELVEVAAASRLPLLTELIARHLGGAIVDAPEPVVALLDRAAADPRLAAPVLRGLDAAFDGWRKAPQPANWPQVSEAFAKLDDEQLPLRELSVLFGDGRALDEVRELALDRDADVDSRRAALQTLIDNRDPQLREVATKLLDARGINTVAIRGLALFDDPALAERIADNYRKRFQSPERPQVIDVLVSRPGWAAVLLDHVEAGEIPKSAITPFHARQIAAFEDDELSQRLSETWGEVRVSDESKKRKIEQLEAKLTPEALAAADLSQGRLQFQASCASCHKLYGEGLLMGPDLTGSGRADLHYLLENIVDPSGVVSVEYQMNTVTLADGRVLAGMVTGQTERTLTLRLLNQETTVEKSEIAEREVMPVSMMPEGLADTMSAERFRDLIAYLQHPEQVPLPE